MTQPDPTDLIGTLAEGYVGSRCLHVVASLGVADVVTNQPRPVTDVALSLSVDAAALGRVVRHLASLGIFKVRGGDISHNDASRLLKSDDGSGLLPLARMLGLPVIWESFGSLEDAVRTGQPGTTFHDPDGFFAYLDRHPEESAVYDDGMAAMTSRRIDRIVPHYDFSAFNTIADIGGGGGHLLRAVLDTTRDSRGVLVDRAQVLADVEPHDRISLQAGSFLSDPLPPADCYLLSNIIHDWPDEDAVTILDRIRAAAQPRSTLLLFEFVIPEDAAEFEASGIDIYMLALVGGRERTLAEYVALLDRGGWRFSRTIPTPSQTIIEAHPKGSS